jgi:hypothetical protein
MMRQLPKKSIKFNLVSMHKNEILLVAFKAHGEEVEKEPIDKEEYER